ncbi:hypothetical protein Ocin01_18675 [Orchesella cincta]|uniref:Uncharacterized protein n=1 Tax=Orchesella cincta TaxID=48709 RepID=A0A1D2M4U5_ORCCI|nr:hypothetical protein Ocin01_18675 [Orchesella cincta]
MLLRGSDTKPKPSTPDTQDENGNTMSGNSKKRSSSPPKLHNTRGRAHEAPTSGNDLEMAHSPSANGESSLVPENGVVENESHPSSGNGLEVEPLPPGIAARIKPRNSGQNVSSLPVKRIITRKISRTMGSERAIPIGRHSPRSSKREPPSAAVRPLPLSPSEVEVNQLLSRGRGRPRKNAIPPVLDRSSEQVARSSRSRNSMPNLNLELPRRRGRPFKNRSAVDSNSVNQMDQTLSSAVSLVLGKTVNVNAAKSLYPNPEFQRRVTRKASNEAEKADQPSTSTNKRLKRESCESTSTAAFSEDVKPDVEMLMNPAFQASPKGRQNGSPPPRGVREYIPRPSRSRSVKINVERISLSCSLEELPQDNQNGDKEMLNEEDEPEITSTSNVQRLSLESSRTASPVDVKPDVEELEKLVIETTPKPSGSLRRSTRLNVSLRTPQTSQEFAPRQTISSSSSDVAVKVECVTPPPPQENGEAEVVVKTEPESEESSLLDSKITVKTEPEPEDVHVEEEENEVEPLDKEEERRTQELFRMNENKRQLRSTNPDPPSPCSPKTVPIATTSQNAARNTMKSLKRALKTVRKNLKPEPMPTLQKQRAKPGRPPKIKHVHDEQPVVLPPLQSNAIVAVEIIQEDNAEEGQYRVPNYTDEEKRRLYGNEQFVMDVKDVEKDPSNMYIWEILEAQCCLRRYSPCRFGHDQFFCSSPQRWFFAEEEFRNGEFCQRFQPLAINEAKKEVHFAPGWEMKECIVQYPYVDRDFFYRMTKNLGQIHKTGELRLKVMRCMPLMILQNFDPYAIPDLLEQKETEEDSMAKDLLSYIDAWVYIREKIDEFLYAAEQSKKCYFKEKTIKLLRTFPGLYYMPLKMKRVPPCTICFPTQKRDATFKVVLTSKCAGSNGPKPYDPLTLQDIPNGVELTNRQNIKEFWCDECSTAAQKYHRLAHFCYTLYRILRQNVAGDLAIFKAQNIPITDKFVLWMHDVDVNWRYTMFLDLQLTIAEVEAEFPSSKWFSRL